MIRINLNKTMLKQEMLKIALDKMTHYQTDIVYDFETIDLYNESTSPVIIWCVRDTGTFIYTEPDELSDEYKKYSTWFYKITYTDEHEWAIEEIYDNNVNE